MSKKIQLSINEPCHENWEAMNPAEQGNFCGSCQKNVVDFSDMSDRQVAEFFKKPTTGSVCGRFMSDQLDRDIDIPRKRIPWVKYLFQILLPAFFISKASAQKTVGKVAPQARDTSRISVDQEFRMLGTVVHDIIPVCKKDTSIQTVKGEIDNVNLLIRQIKGTITDENGEAIPNAIVFIKGTSMNTNTDARGSYSLKVKKNDILSISSLGFITNELEVGSANIVDVVLKKNSATGTSIVVVAGGVSICRKPPRSKPTRIKGVVMDEWGNGIPYASIQGAVGGAVIVANELGLFEFENDWASRNKQIYVSSTGFRSDTMAIEEQRTRSSDLKIVLKADNALPEVVVTNIGLVGRLSYHYVEKDSLSIKSNLISALSPQNEENQTGRITIYPNPVHGGEVLNFSLKDFENGELEFQILSFSGQTILKRQIYLESETAHYSIAVPRVAAGTYFLILTNPEKQQKFTGKLVIQ